MAYGSVRALVADGDRLHHLSHGNRIRKVDHVGMEPGGPLTSEKSCKARVWRGRTSWWWACLCGETAWVSSWKEAYRLAHRHVKLSRLLEAVAAMEAEDDD